MSRAKKEAALKNLELAKQENKDAYDAVNEQYEYLYMIKDNASSTVVLVESFIDSIRNKPFRFGKKELNKIKKNLRDYTGKEELLRQEKKKNLAGGLAAAGALGVGTFGALKLSAFLAPLLVGKGIKKKIIIAVLLLLVWVIVLVAFLLWKLRNRLFVTKAAISTTTRIKIDTSKVNTEKQKVIALGDKIKGLNDLVCAQINNLQHFRGASYKEFSIPVREELGGLINNTISLTELINQQIND